MENQMLHVFRNTPFGRDTFLQSMFFTKQVKVPLQVFVPTSQQFLLYFPQRVVTVDLNKHFLFDPKTARLHAEALIAEHDADARIFEPTEFTATSLPNLPVSFRYMCCPRSIVDLSTKVGMGYIGPKVRQIVQYTTFPVLMPTPVYKEWKRIVVFFGGSTNAVRAVNHALDIAETSGLPLSIFTKAERQPMSHYEEVLDKRDLLGRVRAAGAEWMFFAKGAFKRLLYEVTSDALLVVGAYGHGVVKELVFGSKMEEIQNTLPNNMLIIGPHC